MFTLVKSGIMKRIKKKLLSTFDIINIELLAFYIGLKITQDYK